jgi:signal transduction histidine kinase
MVNMKINKQHNNLSNLSGVTMTGELFCTLAHELRQPLAAILSNAQAALHFLPRDNPALDEVREILGDIINENKRASEVIKRLHLLLGKNEIQYQTVDVNEMVQEVLALVNSDLANDHIAVNTNLALNLPTVIGDPVLLQQVLLNLLLNACNALIHNDCAERRQLHIHTQWNGDAVQVSVADQGKGIAPDNMDCIFEPFFTTRSQGMGLGLAICRTIINAHAGQLWATNNADYGASFYFTLPTYSGE